MKLKEWADKTGIKYLTAYRWFKSGTLPVKAYQTTSGTILIDDEEIKISQHTIDQNSDATSLFLKKTLEFSKNNSPLEDFAAYIFSNFNLTLKEKENVPRYSKNKPKPEDIQNHFKSFIPIQGEKPKPNMHIPENEEFLSEEESGSLSLPVSAAINNLTNNYSSVLSGVGTAFSSNICSTETSGSLLFNQNNIYSEPIITNLNSLKGFTTKDDILSDETNRSIKYTSYNATISDIDKPRRGRPKKNKDSQ